MGKKIWIFVLALELALIAAFLFSFTYIAVAGTGTNITVISQLNVGNVWPEILNVSLNNGEEINLIANDSKTVYCTAVVRDYNGENDVKNISATLFSISNSTYGGADLGLNHYTNASCYNDTSYGDAYSLIANCSFNLKYYAISGEWNCTIVVKDTYEWNETGSNVSNVTELLAIGLPDTINYGTVNATYVSAENSTEVTNFGNTRVNLSLSGYARTEGDDLAMNCTLGNIGEIGIDYEKYNLTESTATVANLAEFESHYTNLTSSPTVKEFGLSSKLDDTATYSTKDSYWRIYVPKGVAGTCSGNIIFGAVVQNEA